MEPTLPKERICEKIGGDEVKARANFIVKMAQKSFAKYAKAPNWDSQKRKDYSWMGFDKCRNAIASLSTLHIMGLNTEYREAVQIINESFEISDDEEEYILSDLVGDYLGGLISAYALTKDSTFLDKARGLGNLIMSPYKNSTISLLHWKIQPNGSKLIGEQLFISEATYGTLEFNYLSHLTKDDQFLNRAIRINHQMASLPRIDGIITEMVNIEEKILWSKKSTLFWTTGHYLQNLLKGHLQLGATESTLLQEYRKEVDSAMKKGLFTSSKSGHVFARTYDHTKKDYKDFMEYDGLYLGAMLALGAKAMANSLCEDSRLEDDLSRISVHWHLATAITETGQLAHKLNSKYLAPKRFYFNETQNGTNIIKGDPFKYYLLWPELAESYFVLWRLSGQAKWRQYAWELAQAIDKWCFTGKGYAGCSGIDEVPLKFYKCQPTHFISATLKYLWLIFNDAALPLDEWIFNSFGHPLPILKN